MATKKYELTAETKVVSGRTLHRIKALVSFGSVEAGELGGWIEKESNLGKAAHCAAGGDGMNEKILSIFDLCLQLNPTETKQAVTGNKPTVFLNFFGHIAECVISIHTHGWMRDVACDIQYRINTETGACRLYPSESVLGTQCEVDDCIAYLEGLL